MNKNFERAAKDLTYYFELCAKKSGLGWDDDNRAEICFIVENIFDGVQEMIDEAIHNHNHNVKL